MKFTLIAVIIVNGPQGQQIDLVHADSFPTVRRCIEAEKPWVDDYMKSIIVDESTDDHEADNQPQVVYQIQTFCSADDRR